MHYYKRNLGDYAKKAGRLSILQHGAYTLLLDACYDRERFPTESEAIEWTWASTPDEEQAVKFVLSRFFELQDDGTYVQTRVYEELQVYKIGEIQNRLIALSREAKKQKRNKFAEACDQVRAEIKHAPLSKTHAAWSSVVEALIKTHEAPPNQEPLTTNQEPLTNIKNIPSTSVERVPDKNQSNDSPPEKPKPSKFKFTPEQYDLAVRMSCPSKARFGVNFKINLDEWADAVRKLNEIDGHQLRDIELLWRWVVNHTVQSGSFAGWADNCRTPMKLRQRKDGLAYFDIITNQLTREIPHASNRSEQTSAGNRHQGRESLVDRVERKSGEWLKQRQGHHATESRDVDGEIVADDESSLRLQVREPVR